MARSFIPVPTAYWECETVKTASPTVPPRLLVGERAWFDHGWDDESDLQNLMKKLVNIYVCMCIRTPDLLLEKQFFVLMKTHGFFVSFEISIIFLN